jgi:ABC-type glycerol-3-phosphate transport system substrate-binding protein
LRLKRIALSLTLVALLAASLAAAATASAPPKPVTSKPVPVTVTGPLNSVEPDVAVWQIDWTVATTNTGTLKLTPQEA